MPEPLALEKVEPEADDLVSGPLPLTPKEEAFVRFFADPEQSETYGRGTASAEKALYSQPHNAQWRLRRRPRIIARIAEFQDLTTAARGKVLSDLEHERLLALAKGDIQAAVRATELQGKALGLFVDVAQIGVGPTREYDELTQSEAKRLARLMVQDAIDHPDRAPALDGMLPPALPGQASTEKGV
jgi:hypothetical protein